MWNCNVAATNAGGIVTARVTSQYNGDYIYKVGDGTPSLKTGDTHMLAHTQLDASLNIALDQRTQMVVQGLNLTNAPFGYWQGIPTAYVQKGVLGEDGDGGGAVPALRLRVSGRSRGRWSPHCLTRQWGITL